MKTRIIATVLVVVVLILVLGFFMGMTPAPAAADAPVTMPGSGEACDTPPDMEIWWCEKDPTVLFRMDCQPCVVDTRTGEIVQWCQSGWGDTERCPGQWEQWQRLWWHQGGVTADVSVAVHALMSIGGECREVGLPGLGIRLTGCNQPELQTSGEDGEAHWHFWPGYGNGTHTVEWWNGDIKQWQPLLDDAGEQLIFHGSDLELGKTLQPGSVILWDTCE